MWRILQIKEGAMIHRIRRLRWITLPEICRILHILREPNLVIASLFIQNILKKPKGENELFVFLLTKNNITSSPGFSVDDSIIFSGLRFWCHQFNVTKFFLNLVNNSWLWWIMHEVLTNQKQGRSKCFTIFTFYNLTWFLALKIPFCEYSMPFSVRKVDWLHCFSC